jgi:hypothetical protein
MRDFPARKYVGFLHAMEEVLADLAEGHRVREECEDDEEDEQVDRGDDGEGEDEALAGEVGLLEVHHARREREVKAPEEPEAEIEDGLVRLERMPEVDAEPERGPDQRIERHEVGREGDPPVDAISDDVAALGADLERGDFSAGQHGGERVGELVAEDVEPHRARQEEEDDEPRHRAGGERDEPCLVPTPGRQRGAREIDERPDLAANERQQRQADEKLEQFGQHGTRKAAWRTDV